MIVCFAVNTNRRIRTAVKSKDLNNELAIELEDVVKFSQVRGLCKSVLLG